MTLRAEYTLGHSKFNGFLFSFIGEEESGMQLTVFSALTRLGFDPWDEAARLAELPKESATSALASKIATLPEGDWKMSDSQSIARRLVDRLPRRGSPLATESQQRPSVENWKPKLAPPKWLVWFALTAAVLFAVSWLNASDESKMNVGNIQHNNAHFLESVSIEIPAPDLVLLSSFTIALASNQSGAP